jgi:fluoride exporter
VFSWAHLGLVVAGGMLGTAARATLTVLFAPGLGLWLVPTINVVGAFALGLLVGVLSRSGDSPRRRAVQHFVGTGVLGGFTTYSALAVESTDPVWLGLGLAGAIVGTAAAWAALVIGRGRPRRAG